MIKREAPKVKIDLKLADDFLDLKTMNTNVIVEKLENTIKLRGMKIEKRLEKELEKI